MKRWPLLVVLCVGLANAQAPTPQVQTFASLLPAETLAFVEMDDLGGSERWSRETALGRIWAEPEVQAFVQGLTQSMKEAVTRMAGETNPLSMVGLAMDDLFGIEVRHAGLALVDVRFAGLPQIDAVMALEFRSGEEKAAKIIRAARDALTTFLGIPFEELDVRGRKVWRTQMPGHDPCLAMQGNRLVLTTTQARMDAMLQALDEGRQASLATAPRFLDITRRMGAERRALLAYADVRGMHDRGLAIAQGFLNAERIAEFEQGWGKLGLDAVDAVAAADIPTRAGLLRTEMAVTFTERRGLLALMPAGKADHRFARHAPQGALLYGAEHNDLEALLEGVLELASAFEPEARAEFEEGLVQARQALGVDIRNDLLKALGSDWGFYVGAPPGGGLIPDIALFCTLRDRAKLEASLETVARRLGGMAAEEGARAVPGVTHFRGTKIHYVEMASERGEPIPVAPAWAFGEDFVVFGLFPQTVKHALTEKPSMAGNEDFRTLLQLVPEATLSCTYVDTKGLVGWLYNLSVPMLQVLQGGINAELARYGVRLDLQGLPPAEVITQHLTGMVIYTAVEDRCIRTGYVSPFGASVLGGAFAGGVVAGLWVTLLPRGYAIAEAEADDEAWR